MARACIPASSAVTSSSESDFRMRDANMDRSEVKSRPSSERAACQRQTSGTWGTRFGAMTGFEIAVPQPDNQNRVASSAGLLGCFSEARAFSRPSLLMINSSGPQPLGWKTSAVVRAPFQ